MLKARGSDRRAAAIEPIQDVAGDVRDRKVSESEAAAAYGVAMTGNPIQADIEATRLLREERSAARGEITWVFDRGELGRE